MSAQTADKLIRLWKFLNRLPGGYLLFNAVIKWRIPYTASISSRILSFEPGNVRIALKDRRKIRNHLNSIHALALANLGEFTSGLALLTSLPSNVRGIPVNISTDYFKKARGILMAESNVIPPEVVDDMEFKVKADIKDKLGDIVATTTVLWQLGLREDIK
jgi:acyl-coenzyme A thioesterase PaaI-like protein